MAGQPPGRTSLRRQLAKSEVHKMLRCYREQDKYKDTGYDGGLEILFMIFVMMDRERSHRSGAPCALPNGGVYTLLVIMLRVSHLHHYEI